MYVNNIFIRVFISLMEASFTTFNNNVYKDVDVEFRVHDKKLNGFFVIYFLGEFEIIKNKVKL